jgi:ligand-binding sensor domain-containing protein
LLSFLFVVSVVAQAERLPIKIYTTADGLAQNSVNRIVRDSRGFLWLCTEDGCSFQKSVGGEHQESHPACRRGHSAGPPPTYTPPIG